MQVASNEGGVEKGSGRPEFAAYFKHGGIIISNSPRTLDALQR